MSNYDTATINGLQETPAGRYSSLGVELMGILNLREQKTGRKVTQPGELFACLLGMGFRREGETMAVQQRARQFVDRVQQRLVSGNRRNPYYDEVLSVMGELGYRRAV